MTHSWVWELKVWQLKALWKWWKALYLSWNLFVLIFDIFIPTCSVTKEKVNFKICDLINWETNNYITHISQHLKWLRQSGNRIWSVDRKHEFFFKDLAKNETGPPVSDLFLFLKKPFSKLQINSLHLLFHILWYTLTWSCNKNKLYTVDPEIYSILIFFEKGLGIVLYVWFFIRKIFLISY